MASASNTTNSGVPAVKQVAVPGPAAQGPQVPVLPANKYHPGLTSPGPVPAGAAVPVPFALAPGQVLQYVVNPGHGSGTTNNRVMALRSPHFVGQLPPAGWMRANGAVLIDGHLHFMCSRMHTTAGGGEYSLWWAFDAHRNSRDVAGNRLPYTQCNYCLGGMGRVRG